MKKILVALVLLSTSASLVSLADPIENRAPIEIANSAVGTVTAAYATTLENGNSLATFHMADGTILTYDLSAQSVKAQKPPSHDNH